MQAVAHLINNLITQLPHPLEPDSTRSSFTLQAPVITPELPSTPRWSESPAVNPLADSADDVDEDERYFLDEDDEEDDDDDDDYDEDDDEDLNEFDDGTDELDPKKNQDEEDF